LLILYIKKEKKTKKLQYRLQSEKREDTISIMNTLTEIIKNSLESMNQEIVNDLTANHGIDNDLATKVVNEINEFDFSYVENSDF